MNDDHIFPIVERHSPLSSGKGAYLMTPALSIFKCRREFADIYVVT